MQSIQKSYVEDAPRSYHPTKDKDVFEQEKMINFFQPLSENPGPLYRNSVLARRRTRAKHPLREFRLRAGLTLKELAEAIRMSPSYLSRIETGARRLNSDILQSLSQALSCKPADLLPENWSYSVNEAEMQGYLIEKDLPVYRLAGTMENHGHIYVDVAEQWVSRPAELFGIKGAFACVINESNFGPRYSDGDRILLHPTAPFTNQCSVLAITNDNEAYIGRFISWDAGAMTMNPLVTLEISRGKNNEVPKMQKVTFERSQLKGIYRIIGTFEGA